MLTFSDLQWQTHGAGMGGKQALAFFPNGYGASVVRFPYSYGAEAGLYELAVIAGDNENWTLTYDTPITDDVMGHLSEQDVSDILDRISQLPSRANPQGEEK